MKRLSTLFLGLALFAPALLSGCGDEAAKPADKPATAPADKPADAPK